MDLARIISGPEIAQAVELTAAVGHRAVACRAFSNRARRERHRNWYQCRKNQQIGWLFDVAGLADETKRETRRQTEARQSVASTAMNSVAVRGFLFAPGGNL